VAAPPPAAHALSAGEIAALTGGRLVGPAETRVTRVAPLERAEPGDLAFLAAARYLPYFRRSTASVVLLREEFAAETEGPAVRVVVADPQVALLAILPVLYPQAVWEPGVHPTAVVGRSSTWEDPVAIGPHVVLGRGVRLGRNVRLGSGCVLGDGVVVGDEVEMYPNVVCYAGTQIGHRVILHAGVRLGSDGFGYIQARGGGGGGGGGHRKIPHVGRCLVGDDVEIGANSCVDRGSVDDTVIGPGTKIDNLVHIAHNVRIGARCLIMALVGVAGSSRIEDEVILAGQAGVSDHLTVGRGARVLVQAGLIGDVPAGATVSGYPARNHRELLRAQATLYRLADIIHDLEALVAKQPDAAQR